MDAGLAQQNGGGLAKPGVTPPNGKATILFEPTPFRIRVFVNGEELGIVGDKGNSFQYSPREEFNTVLVERTTRGRSLYTNIFLAQPGTVHRVVKVKKPTENAVIYPLVVEFSPALPKLVSKDSEATKNALARFPKTLQFWKSVQDTISAAEKRFAAVSPLLWDMQEAAIEDDLILSLAELPTDGVDPDLVRTFRDVRECHKYQVAAKRKTETAYASDLSIGSLKTYMNGRSVLKEFFIVQSSIKSMLDVRTACLADKLRAIQELEVTLKKMEYRYGQTFPACYPPVGKGYGTNILSKKMALELEKEVADDPNSKSNPTRATPAVRK